MPAREIVARDAMVVGICAQRRAAAFDETQRPVELLLRQITICIGMQKFIVQLERVEATAERNGDEVLHQHVERLLRRIAAFDLPLVDGFTRGRRFDQFERMRRHDRHARRQTGRMSRAARALHQARDAFWRADLEHPFHRQKIDAEVETRRTHDNL